MKTFIIALFFVPLLSLAVVNPPEDKEIFPEQDLVTYIKQAVMEQCDNTDTRESHYNCIADFIKEMFVVKSQISNADDLTSPNIQITIRPIVGPLPTDPLDPKLIEFLKKLEEKGRPDPSPSKPSQEDELSYLFIPHQSRPAGMPDHIPISLPPAKD